MSKVSKCDQDESSKAINEVHTSKANGDTDEAHKMKTAEVGPQKGHDEANERDVDVNVAKVEMPRELQAAAAATKDVPSGGSGGADLLKALVDGPGEGLRFGGEHQPTTNVGVSKSLHGDDGGVVDVPTETTNTTGGRVKVTDVGNGNFAADVVKMPMPVDLQAVKEKAVAVGGSVSIAKEKSQGADAGQQRDQHEPQGKEHDAKALAVTVDNVVVKVAVDDPVKTTAKVDGDDVQLTKIGAERQDDAVRPVAMITQPRMTVENARFRRMSRAINNYDQGELQRQLAASAAPPRLPLVQQHRPAPRLPDPVVKPKPDRPPIVDAVLLDRSQATRMVARAMALENAERAARQLRESAEKAEEELRVERMTAERELSQHLSPNIAVGTRNASTVQEVLRRCQVRSEVRASKAMGAAMCRARRTEGALTAPELSSRQGLQRANSIEASVTRELAVAPIGADLSQLVNTFNTFSDVLDRMQQRKDVRQPLPKQPKFVMVSPTTSVIAEDSELSMLANDDADSEHTTADATKSDEEDILTMLLKTFRDEIIKCGAPGGEDSDEAEVEDESMEVDMGSMDSQESMDDQGSEMGNEADDKMDVDGYEVRAHDPFDITIDMDETQVDSEAVLVEPATNTEQPPRHRSSGLEDEDEEEEEAEDEEEESETSDDTFERFYRHRSHAEKEPGQVPQVHVQREELPDDDDQKCAKTRIIFTKAVRQQIEAGLPQTQAGDALLGQQNKADDNGPLLSPIFPDDTTALFESSGEEDDAFEMGVPLDNDQDVSMSGEKPENADETQLHVDVPQSADARRTVNPAKRMSDDDDLKPSPKRQRDVAEERRFVMVGQPMSIAETVRVVGPQRPRAVVQTTMEHRDWALVLYSPPDKIDARMIALVDSEYIVQQPADEHRPSQAKRKAADDEQEKKLQPTPKRQRGSAEETPEIAEERRFVIVGNPMKIAETMRAVGPRQPPAVAQHELEHRNWAVVVFVPPVARVEDEVEPGLQAFDEDARMDDTPPPSPDRVQQQPPQQPFQPRTPPPQGPPAGGPVRNVHPLPARPAAWIRPPGHRLRRNRNDPVARRALGPYPATVQGAIAEALARIDSLLAALVELVDGGGNGLLAALDQQRAAVRARTSLRRLDGMGHAASMADVLKVVARLEKQNQGFPVLF